MDPTNGDARLDSLEAKMQALEQRIPDSGIISRSFWKRLFTVFGYTVVIYLFLLPLAAFVFGMMAAIAIPKFADTKEKAYMAGMRSDLRNLVLAEEAYFAQTGLWGNSVYTVDGDANMLRGNTAKVNDVVRGVVICTRRLSQGRDTLQLRPIRAV